MIRFITMISVTLTLSACARNLDSNTYTSDNTVGKVVPGVIVSARAVTVKDADEVQDNTIGAVSGGLLGGVGGSTVGGGTGQSLATIGGAIAGAVAGAYLEDQLGTQEAAEYVVRLQGSAPEGTDTIKIDRTERGSSIEDDVKGSIEVTPSQSDYISVVQDDEALLKPGQRVLVIYHDDRPRVVPDI